MLSTGFVNTYLPNYPIWAPATAGQPMLSHWAATHLVTRKMHVSQRHAGQREGIVVVAESHRTVSFHASDLLDNSHMRSLCGRWKCSLLGFPPGRWVSSPVNVYSRVSAFPWPYFFLLTYWTGHGYCDPWSCGHDYFSFSSHNLGATM